MARVSLDGVSKHFGAVKAVDGLTLEVGDGELLVLLGPSGCGKSTILRTIAGLETPTSGTVRIGDRDVTSVPAGRRDVAMVFQNFALFPHMDVADNIGFGLVARHVRGPEVRRRVAEAAEVVGCADLLGRRPHELSGGERQRVALARALVREPAVFLLDEPLSNLDAQLRVAMRAELQRLHRRLGATMLHVTHDQYEGLSMADRLAVLRDGALQQIGTPDEVYRSPVNRFVASFVGSPPITLIPAEIAADGLVAGPFAFAIDDVLAHPNAPRLAGRRLEVGFRPENIRLAPPLAGVRAEVQIVETGGSDTFLHLAAGDRTLVFKPLAALRPRVGQELWIEASLDECYIFDADTGATLIHPS